MWHLSLSDRAESRPSTAWLCRTISPVSTCPKIGSVKCEMRRHEDVAARRYHAVGSPQDAFWSSERTLAQASGGAAHVEARPTVGGWASSGTRLWTSDMSG
jgi:hypothetical protein